MKTELGANSQNHSHVERLDRIPSHALVDVQVNLWNPFSKFSAVIIDLTVKGFKLEFVESVRIKEKIPVRFTIPLAPFRITDRRQLKIAAMLLWFDSGTMRAGGIFENLTEGELGILQQIVTHLKR